MFSALHCMRTHLILRLLFGLLFSSSLHLFQCLFLFQQAVAFYYGGNDVFSYAAPIFYDWHLWLHSDNIHHLHSLYLYRFPHIPDLEALGMNRREPINYHSSLFHSLMAYMLGLGFHSTLNWLYLQEIIHEDIFTYLWLA